MGSIIFGYYVHDNENFRCGTEWVQSKACEGWLAICRVFVETRTLKREISRKAPYAKSSQSPKSTSHAVLAFVLQTFAQLKYRMIHGI